MNKLDDQYLNLLRTILREGKIKKDRTGTGTQSIFGYQIRHNMADGFPLLTTKKVHFKGIITELLWFLKGDTNIAYLIENGCNIWNGDAYKKFKTTLEECAHPACSPEEFAQNILDDQEFAEQWGYLGPIYGAQWRRWHNIEFEDKYRLKDNNVHNRFDQIAMLINDLRNNPDSRRLMVSAWNVGQINQMTLPPCHYAFQCYTSELTTDERIEWVMKNNDVQSFYSEEDLDRLNVPKRWLSLMWNQRSVDTPLGLPFNIASYGLLLSLLAKHVNMVPDQLIGNLGDTHIYLNQMDGVKEQLTRTGFDLPRIIIEKAEINDISEYKIDHIQLFNYQSGPKINFPLSN
jgi:thymidylate synthase